MFEHFLIYTVISHLVLDPIYIVYTTICELLLCLYDTIL